MLGDGIHIYFEHAGARRNKFTSLQQESLRNLGKRIHEYRREKGDYPESFEELIRAGRMTRDEVVFLSNGHKVVREYKRPTGINAPSEEVMVLETYDFLEGYVNTLTVDGHVSLVKTVK